jgi:predicted ester cyclase
MHSQRTPGRQALIQTFDGFSVLVPDLRITVEDIIAGGDWAAVRPTVTGTSAGPYLGVDPAGSPIRFEAIDLWRIENGLVTEGWHVEDFAAALVDWARSPSRHGHETWRRRRPPKPQRAGTRSPHEHRTSPRAPRPWRCCSVTKASITNGSGARLHGRPGQQGQSSHSRNR